MLPFRLLDTPPAPGAWNMGLDAALVDGVREGGRAVLRLYRWAPPCLSLGRNQPGRGRYDEEGLRAAGIDVVRRPTGGRAVLHHRELTYAAILPQEGLGGPRRAYAAVNRALVRGLRRLGVAAELQAGGRGRAAAPSLHPCFAGAAEGEVVVGGRKLVGSAQVRERGVLLQHGSLLLHDDQPLVARFLRAPPPPAADGGYVTLGDLLDPLPPWEALAAALAAGWEEEMGAPPEPDAPTAAEEAGARAHAARFADPAWTWRC